MLNNPAFDTVLIGIDTNVLARYLLQDDKPQTLIATEFLENLDQQRKGFISLIVLVEIFWLLKKGRKLPKDTLVIILETLLANSALVFEHDTLVVQAFNRYRDSSADFPDCLIVLVGKANRCNCTVTFDIGAVNQANMRLLSTDLTL